MMIDSKRVFVDTSLFIYLIENHAQFGQKARLFLNDCLRRRVYLVSSTLTYMEFCVKPYREKHEEIIKRFDEMLIGSGIQLIDMNKMIADQAARLRANYESLKTADSIQLATALHQKCDLFITNDKRLKTIQKVPVYLLEEWTN